MRFGSARCLIPSVPNSAPWPVSRGSPSKSCPCNAVIHSDPKLLRRALQNFLTNAFRYNPKGKVVLGVRRRGSGLQVEVWDNGPGIPEEKQAHIFDEFTRIERSGVDHGLGLGLAIARGISRVLDHSLSLRSWPGKGTVFALGVRRGVLVEAPEKPSAGRKSTCPTGWAQSAVRR